MILLIIYANCNYGHYHEASKSTLGTDLQLVFVSITVLMQMTKFDVVVAMDYGQKG